MNNSKTKIKTVNYFPALTGVRAIAAFMVFFHHFNPFNKNGIGGVLHNFTNEFHIGVTLFFVLSGFLIAFRYYDEKKFNFKKYMINRMARIYPMYFILTTLTFIVLYVLQHPNVPHTIVLYFNNITFIKGFFSDYKFTGIAQGWSLTVEELFYFTAPLYFILLKRKNNYLVLLPAVISIVGLLLVLVFSRYDFHGFFSDYKFMFNYTFFGRCSEFFIGIALALFYKKHGESIKTKWATYMGIAFIIICLIALSLLKGDCKYGTLHPMGIVINNLLLPFFGIAILFWGLLTEKTIVQRILSSDLFVLLGKSSYVFYLIHLGVIQLLIAKFISGNYFILFVLINCISIILFKMMEEPINIYLRKKLS